MIPLRAYPKVGVSIYWASQNLSDKDKCNSDRFNTSRKYLGNRKLQIDCSSEKERNNVGNVSKIMLGWWFTFYAVYIPSYTVLKQYFNYI